jgi:hypothetical protein
MSWFHDLPIRKKLVFAFVTVAMVAAVVGGVGTLQRASPRRA